MWDDLVPPSSHDVFAISNSKAPPTGTRTPIDHSKILKHLDKGRVFYRHDALQDFIEEQNLVGVEIYDRTIRNRSGIIATADKRIIFWTLLSHNVLRLETSDLKVCYLLYLDKWDKKRSDDLKQYMDSSNADKRTYTRSKEEEIKAIKAHKQSFLELIDAGMAELREAWKEFEEGPKEETNSLLQEVAKKRSSVELLQTRIIEIDRKLKPLELQAEFPTPPHIYHLPE